jgi:hypothetical protein
MSAETNNSIKNGASVSTGNSEPKYGTYTQKKRYQKKNGDVVTYEQPIKRKLSGRRLTVEEIKKIEPVIKETINKNPGATLKRIHEIINAQIPVRCSISLVYKYIKC